MGTGSVPSTETISLKYVLFPVQLHDGVLAHAAARRLDHSGYTYEKGPICDLEGNPVDLESLPCEPGLVPATGAVMHLSEKSADGELMSTKLEQFVRCGQASVSYEDETTNYPVHFCARSELQKWLCLGRVDFAELFRGFGELTVRVRRVDVVLPKALTSTP